MAASTDQLEVEWQFSAPSTDRVLEWLAAANVPGYTVTAGATKELHDTYYDTADWRFHRARFTCRVRQKGDGAELTLKSMAAAKDAVRSRREITDALAGPGPYHLMEATGTGGQYVRLLAGRRAIAPLFRLDQLRRTFLLSDATGEIAEIAVDRTTIPTRAEAPAIVLSRVEVEITAGAIARAQRFVDLLVATAGLAPAGTSKFEAALQASGAVPTALEATLGSTAVEPGMTVSDVAFAVLRKHFAVFLVNEASTRLGEDIEGLHDMRVAARRLRAALQAFRPWLSPRLQHSRDELGWVAASLGVVRDLDVQMERLAEWRAAEPAGSHALDEVERLLTDRRNQGRKRMLAALDSRRYDLMVQRFAAALQRGSPRSLAAAREPILAVAPGLLEKRYRRLRRGGDAIKSGSPAAAYHALRIDAKKLRYALEFVGPIYGKPATEFAVRLTALQDLLGLHQDADVAIEMLHDMAASPRPRLNPETILALGAISERYRVHAAALRKGFPKVYGPLGGPEWRALRKVLEARRPRMPAPPG
ncbi:MAG: CHAD domain-containing protein [Dehalococcoidia bacterium]